ncbi:GNAT family N-acetyltransferase [Blastococcus tunisiensis]|uniref:Acyl-CoA synthetase (NDP forming) n=1 Tax=Blastococcus tunisiensis TaxID=1798228 RepID=A0A1I2E3K9_9ACTN|nr:GNAT family N-acetyltransferase [Blastococcus sp. DSM 46838]SFE86790.1 Acyl-CoA synthetase (NDP forming) [Blastococcus sp. DSM 46838]
MEEAGPAGPRTPTRVLLADGSPALLYRLGPSDLPDCLDLHDRLSDRDRYLRFSTLHPADLRGYLERTLGGAHGAVSLGARVRDRLVGAVQFVPVEADVAEVAAVVDSAWHSHGVGTVLLEELAAVAVGAGIQRLVADVLAENGPMTRVLSDLGLPVEFSRQGPEARIEVMLHGDERYAAASEDRHRRAAAASLRPILRPATVAVVGAGRGEGSVGRAVLRSLREAGFEGAVVAVNPHAGQLEGTPCWPSIAAVPCTVDLAVVTVPATAVAAVLQECGEHGVRAVVLITSGLGDVPGLTGEVRTLADRYAMRVVGPNTVGVVGPGDGGRLDTTFTDQLAPAGDIGLVAQSGGIAIATVSEWRRLGMGLSAMVAIGDALDVGARDVLAWFDEDPGTALVVLYAESEPDLRGLIRTATHLSARVPVLALPAGTSSAGQRAAASHTARAATPRALREAAYASGGIQVLPDLPSMATAIGLLQGQPLPEGPSVAVLTNVGGGGVLAADACTAAGLTVDPLSAGLQARLRAVLPPLASVGNPVDAGAAVGADAFAAALGCLLDSPEVGAVLTVTAPTAVSDPAVGVPAAAAAAAVRGTATALIDVQLVRPTTVERIELAGAPPGRFLVSVNEPGLAARALGVAVRRRAWLSRRPGPPTVPEDIDIHRAHQVVAAARTRLPSGGWLLPLEVDALCRAAGIPAVPITWVTTAEEAIAAVRRTRGPVALKGVVDGVVHKGDAGLLRLPVTDAGEAGRTVAEWAGRAGPRWVGAVVQPLVAPGDELLVGAVRDPSAGPVVALGPGGRATDALGHRVHRLAPPTDADVDDMLVATELFGTGHGRSLDLAGIRDCVRRVAWLADALPEIVEIDVNPLVVTPESSVALDVRVRVAPRDG